MVNVKEQQRKHAAVAFRGGKFFFHAQVEIAPHIEARKSVRDRHGIELRIVHGDGNLFRHLLEELRVLRGEGKPVEPVLQHQYPQRHVAREKGHIGG